MIRIGVLAAMAAITIASVVTLGIFLVNTLSQEGKPAETMAIAQSLVQAVQQAINSVPPVPVCVTTGNVDIGSTFPDTLFSVYKSNDITAKIRFDLSALEANTSSDVVVTIRDQNLNVNPEGGTIAYISDIPAVPRTAFSETVFGMRNTNVDSKLMRFDLNGLWINAPLQTQTLSVQTVSGVVAYLSDITQFGGFLDDVFTIFHDGDPRRQVMFDASGVSSDSTVHLKIQDTSGTIILLAQTVAEVPPFADDVFRLQKSSDNDAQLRFNLDNVIPDVPVTAHIRDTSGTIAYLSDTREFVEVWINTTRDFPDSGVEGVGTLAELGAITYLDISLCGGGGGGGAFVSPYIGAGGGSGSGHELFPIHDPHNRFSHFTITIGQGGSGNADDHGSNGGRTRIVGNSADGFYLDLSGWGGGGGGKGTGLNAKGGSGGGGGGGATTVDDGVGGTINSRGPAGPVGSFAGGLGGRVNDQPSDGASGALSRSWHAGGGGGAQNGNGAAWLHGIPSHPCPGGGCGADGMFGLGGTPDSPDGGPCAGGGRGPASGGGRGGDGRVLIRYSIAN